MLLKHVGRNWPNPDCTFHNAVSLTHSRPEHLSRKNYSKNNPVCKKDQDDGTSTVRISPTSRPEGTPGASDKHKSFRDVVGEKFRLPVSCAMIIMMLQIDNECARQGVFVSAIRS